MESKETRGQGGTDPGSGTPVQWMRMEDTGRPLLRDADVPEGTRSRRRGRHEAFRNYYRLPVSVVITHGGRIWFIGVEVDEKKEGRGVPK